jgi:ABC-type nickel/cobalt efflux system permease component RcnA
MTGLLSLVFLGLLLGIRHATDPDHVVAVTAIASRERSMKRAMPIGLLWGVGHGVTVLVVGGAIALFGIVVPTRLGLGLELSVACMLIALGVWSLATRSRPGRDHSHDDPVIERLDRVAGRFAWWPVARPLAMGFVHGLAGSAAAALLVVTMQTRLLAMSYLLCFALGTLLGMVIVTAGIAAPMSLAARKFERSYRFFRIAAAVVSVGFGCFLAYDITIVHGLFSQAPNWQPP